MDKIKGDSTNVLKNKIRRIIKKKGDYMRVHNLDPDKDYSRDPVHGDVLNGYIKSIQLLEEKLNRVDLKKLVKPKLKKKVKEVNHSPYCYEYPEIDGKPMSKELMARYRRKMRALMKARLEEGEAEKKAIRYITKISSRVAEEYKKEGNYKKVSDNFYEEGEED